MPNRPVQNTILAEIAQVQGNYGFGTTWLGKAGRLIEGNSARSWPQEAGYRGQGMSDTDTFIDEVTEEVRRDHLFALMKRYGWIAVVAIILIVGGASYNEYRKAVARAVAEQLGDDIISALAVNDAAGRAESLSKITAETPRGAAVLQFMVSAAQANSDQVPQAVAGLNAVARNGDLPEIYRQIASFKALTLQGETLPEPERRLQFEALAQAGKPLRLLAEEQLALIDISEGQAEPAIARLQAILQDAEVSADLQRRVSQMIVALGGVPNVRSGIQG